MKARCPFLFSLLITICLGATGWSQTGEQAEDQLHLARRVNAHGDEFNAAALTQDERYLIIGTEKGELLVWGLAERRLVRSFKQNSPIHGLVMLADGRRVVTAGGWHTGEMNAGTVGQWDLESGDYEEWPANASGTFYMLTSDPRSGYILGVDLNGRITAWADSSGQVVATWELNKVVTGLAVIGNNTIRLSEDETKILFGGHHRDVAVLDATDGRELLSIAVASADFYVTNVWSGGERLIFTTDAGVMLDGRISRNSR